jgi:hypothetical protein
MHRTMPPRMIRPVSFQEPPLCMTIIIPWSNAKCRLWNGLGGEEGRGGRLYIYIYIYIYNIHMYARAPIHMCTYIWGQEIWRDLASCSHASLTYMHVTTRYLSIYIATCMCIYIHTHIYVYIYISSLSLIRHTCTPL